MRRLTALLVLSAGLVDPALSIASDSSGNDSYPDEVSWVGENVYSHREWPSDSGWGISYFKIFSPHLAASLAYLNDAHFPGHHRDGVAPEIWVPLVPFGNRLTLSAGVGAFYYYDTVFAEQRGGYADAHGWAWLTSLRATLQPSTSWPHLFVEARVDFSAPAKSIETTSLGLGIGYRGISDAHIANQSTVFADNEIVASYWKTVTNSFNSTRHQAPAGAVDFRKKLWHEARLSVGYLYEGNTQLVRRGGITTEGWLEPSFSSGLWSIGAGFGFYSAIDKYRATPGRHVSDMVSVTLSLHPARNLAMRFLWHRIVTNYNRDADVLLLGVGYGF